jgi:hypothetical protein
MQSRRFVKFLFYRSRRWITGIALVAYLASVWGYPLPRAGSADASTPFPCQQHQCGCHSAEQCWKSCCCFTPAQRVAWARERGVTIPAEAQSVLLADHNEHRGDDRKSCCASHDHANDKTACHVDAQDGAKTPACSKCVSRPGESKVTWVLGIEARKCQGLSTLWIASGASLPLEILPLWEFDWAPAGQILLAADSLEFVSFAPPVPPPRA